jgi:hypothetical protein
MERDHAVHYLSAECVTANADPVALEAEWQSATARIQPPQPSAGVPQIRDIPTDYSHHIDAVRNAPEWQMVFANNPNWEFKLVEAAPLLAYQFSILDGTVSSHNAQLGLAPSLDVLLESFLPTANVPQGMNITQTPNSALIQSRSLNVRPLNFAMPIPGTFVLEIGSSLPFVHVVRYNGRCYLHNGYHRVYAALQSGASEIPCIFRDAASEIEIGLSPGTFNLPLLESQNPPTLHHYASGQAHPVDLVIKTRTIHLNWTDWVSPEI